MTCEELADLLLDFVGGDVTPEQRATFEEHLCACKPCVIVMEEYRLTIRLTKALPRCEPIPEAFARRLREALGIPTDPAS
jgi:anti-sigma factor RsiW